MSRKLKLFALIGAGWSFLLGSPLGAATVASPNKRIAVTVEVKPGAAPDPSGGRLWYSVTFDGKPLLLDSPFQLDFVGAPSIAGGLAVTGEKRRSLRETWKPVWGTASSIANNANELTLSIGETAEPKRRLSFVVRVFDDGVAFRYELPAQPALGDFQLASEKSEFHFDGNKTVWAAHEQAFKSSQEVEYRKGTLEDLRPGDIIGCPLLVQAGPAWVALTEANLTDWAGIYFTAVAGAPHAVTTLLSPRPDEKGVAVIGSTPRVSPWRTMIIGARPGDLIESNIIQNLSEPSAIKDTAWIRPGVSAWDRWWSGSYGPDYNGKLGMDTASMKYFVDFAAEMGWQYQLVDWYWYGDPFKKGVPQGDAGNPDADLTKPVPEIDIPGLVQYAAKKGVRIWLWTEWDNAGKQMEKAFPLFEKWGVAGVKVDFMNRDDQVMVNFYERFAKLAAKYHLLVDFHGAYKPTGMERTYPNVLTREGVMGNEYNKWSRNVTPTHKATLPFTRMLAGPMDFTPGGFRQSTVKTFRPIGEAGPMVMGTRANELAMPVVYFSAFTVMCDSPGAYRASPAGLDFWKGIPTSWDETKVIDGFPGEYVVIARRSGRNWYIGGLNGDAPRAVEIPLAFLGSGEYTAKIYLDAEDSGDRPEHLAERQATVTGRDKLSANMVSGGGYAVRLAPVK